MVNINHHSEKPTPHPLRKWRKAQNPRVALETLAETMDCTRAHLSMIEHYKLMPSYSLTLKLSLLTGISMEDMAPPHKANQERKHVRERFAVAVENHSARTAGRQRETEVPQGRTGAG
jgi:transcriptional regulator with XRE-family HTH domain